MLSIKKYMKLFYLIDKTTLRINILFFTFLLHKNEFFKKNQEFP